MNSSSTSTSYPSVPMNKRQDTLVASRTEFTIFPNATDAGWDNHNRSKGKKSSKKMKFPRRNSLNFPLTPSSVREENPVPEDDDPFMELIKQRISSSKTAFPISSEIKKALVILNKNNTNSKDYGDNHSLSETSKTSISTSSTNPADDEVINVNEFSKGASAISTPVPQRKQALQFPMAKRKQMVLLSSRANGSPVSVAESLNFPSLSISEESSKKKNKPKKAIVSKSRDSSEKSKSRDSSEKSSSKLRDSSEKSSRRKSKKKDRKSSSRKKVRFKQTCTMRRTLSRKDMTPKEIRRAWLSSEEYHRMQIRDEILAERVDAGRCKYGTCIRGLESKIEESAMKKLDLRVTGVEEVLIEQERQWDDAGDCPNFQYNFSAFAYVYGPVSDEALIAAQETAKQDRKEAERILASPNSFKSKGTFARFTRRRSWA